MRLSLYFIYKEEKMLKSNITLTKQKTKRRAFTVLLSLALTTCLLLFNIFRLDFFLYDHYREKAFDQITTTSTLKAERGEIYDANMNLLATTKTTWRVFVSTTEIKKASKKNNVDYAEIIAAGMAEMSVLK